MPHYEAIDLVGDVLSVPSVADVRQFTIPLDPYEMLRHSLPFSLIVLNGMAMVQEYGFFDQINRDLRTDEPIWDPIVPPCLAHREDRLRKQAEVISVYDEGIEPVIVSGRVLVIAVVVESVGEYQSTLGASDITRKQAIGVCNGNVRIDDESMVNAHLARIVDESVDKGVWCFE